MKRKPTPAQIAARERFAEMARSGAFKRKAKRNPAKKTVSQKISQLTREGYPQKQAVAIALSEQRAGKVRRNPRAFNPIILVSDKPIASKRKANPVKRVALPYVVEAKRDIGGETVNMGAIAAFPGRAQADDYAKALQSRHKGLKLTVKAR